MRARSVQISVVVIAAAAALTGCSSSSGDPAPSGSASGGAGTSQPGTKATVGGSADQSGGAAAKGGNSNANSSSSSNSSNSSSSGGASNSGGATATASSNASGGRVASGSGSIAKSGSSSAVGGSVTRGGSAANGSAPIAAGKSGSDGTEPMGNGGRISNGGRPGASGSPVGLGGAAAAGRSAAAGGAAAAGASTGSGAGKTHLFLLLGQSNMAGYPKANDADKVKNPRITVLGFDDCTATGRKKDKWDTAAPPLHECFQGAIGPGDWFSKTLLDSLPAEDTIGLIPCAFSGEKVETFLKSGGSHYARIIERAKLAMQTGGKIEGMLFHQGESNCGDSKWPNNVKQMVTDLKGDLGFGDIPFLVGEFSSGSKCTSQNALISQLPGLIPTAVVVPGKDLKIDPADTQYTLHFDHDSQVTFGKRFAEAMKTALKW